MNAAPFSNKYPGYYEAKTTAVAEAEYDLHKAGFSWTTGNSGIHLIVYRNGKAIADLWPTTERWSIRREDVKGKRAKTGFGVSNLIEHLGVL